MPRRAEAILAGKRNEVQADRSCSGCGNKLLGARRASPGMAEPFDGLAYAQDAKFLRDASKSVENLRKYMRVLVGIEVSGRNAGAFYLFDLGAKLRFDIATSYSPSADASDESTQRPRQSSFRIDERADIARRRDTLAADQHEMAPNPECRRCKSRLDGVVERAAVGHQSRTRKNPFTVCADNSIVDASCKSEVVRVQDKLFGHRRDLYLEAPRIISRGRAQRGRQFSFQTIFVQGGIVNARLRFSTELLKTV
jgi:hypothetical protein